ncbi:hypothetical protein F5884DRAFT_810418 [Xylogone sp. PMI_703]|nr:hypothetical protein F5884DRAFT_810418 [Xylogone sp. PMI_703]
MGSRVFLVAVTMSQEPAAAAPPGVASNLNNPSGNLHFWLNISQYLCIPIIAIFVFTRIYVKIFMLHQFYSEDWLCLISWILGTAWFALQIASADTGGGYHQWDVSKQNLVLFYKTNYAQMVLYGPMILMVKLSILFMLARFFDPYYKWVIFIYVFSALLTAYTIAATVSKICICQPISTFWYGVDVTHGRCLQQLEIFLTDTVVSVVSDIIILILPTALISKVNMAFKKKVRVALILAAGGLVCVVTIVRLVWVVIYRNSADKTWTIKRIDVVTNAEIAVGIICACLPSVAILVARVNKFVSARYGLGVAKSSTSSRSPMWTRKP